MIEKERIKQKRKNWEWNIAPHFKNVTYIFLRLRVRDKLAWLSFCERKTCEECSREGSFCRAGNHRHREN